MSGFPIKVYFLSFYNFEGFLTSLLDTSLPFSLIFAAQGSLSYLEPLFSFLSLQFDSFLQPLGLCTRVH